MGHRKASNLYIKGTKIPIATSDTGVRQGNPAAGMNYYVAQTDMLQTMVKELAIPMADVRISGIVDDISMQGDAKRTHECHQWLKKNGTEWGYLLNEDYGKTTVIPGPQIRNLMGGTASKDKTEQEQQMQGNRKSNRGTRVIKRFVAGPATNKREGTTASTETERSSQQTGVKQQNRHKKQKIARSISTQKGITPLSQLFPKVHKADGAVLLGIPIGPSMEFRNKWIENHKNKILDFIKKLSTVQDDYVQYLLLKHCTMSWARFITTTIPIRHGDFAMQEYIRDIDEAVLQVVSRMLGIPWKDLNNSTKLAEIALPTKFGGMGIQRMCAIAPISHIGAVTCALPALKKHSKSIVTTFKTQCDTQRPVWNP